MLTGTPAYLPPESLLLDLSPDRHGDDYSFAVMAYEMLVGVLPFQGEGLVLLGSTATGRRPTRTGTGPGSRPPPRPPCWPGWPRTRGAGCRRRSLAARLAAVPAAQWPPLPDRQEVESGDATRLDAPGSRPLTLDRTVLAAARRRPRRRTDWLSALAALLIAVGVVTLLVVRSGSPDLAVEQIAVAVSPAEGPTGGVPMSWPSWWPRVNGGSRPGCSSR